MSNERQRSELGNTSVESNENKNINGSNNFTAIISNGNNNENGLLQRLTDKFTKSSYSRDEQNLNSQTIGLVSAADYKKLQLQNNLDNSHSNNSNENGNNVEETDEQKAAREKLEKIERKKRLKEKKRQIATLSFTNYNDDEEDEEIHDTKKSKHLNGNSNSKSTLVLKSLKDPTVDTSFLPDKQRDLQKELERQRLEEEWQNEQERLKNEKLEITYSYWTGSGHRRTAIVQQKNSIGEFLEIVRKALCTEFRELKSLSADGLLFVKEDLIIPQDLTFHDLIVTKARGKSGPLFCFDVHDDVRIGAIDHRVEKSDSHPGKVVERRWYERNKHIFPASRWELYDPAKDYGQYKIKGK